MRAFQLLHATKVLIALCVLTLSVTGFAEAAERGRHHLKRPHHNRHYEQRLDYQTRTYNTDRSRYDRRQSRRNWRQHDRRDDRHLARDHRRHEGRDWNRDRDDFPSDIQGDAYFGGLSAWRDGRNGTYFSSEGYGYDHDDGGHGRDMRRRRGKIIYVTPSTLGRSCSYEAGVCVMRR